MAGTARGPIAFAQYAALRAAALAVRAGDEATALGLAGDVGRLIGQLPRNQRRTVTHLAQAFPERSLADLEALGRDSFAHLAQLFVAGAFVPADDADSVFPTNTEQPIQRCNGQNES